LTLDFNYLTYRLTEDIMAKAKKAKPAKKAPKVIVKKKK
jgi:hypothetical protein